MQQLAVISFIHRVKVRFNSHSAYIVACLHGLIPSSYIECNVHPATLVPTSLASELCVQYSRYIRIS